MTSTSPDSHSLSDIASDGPARRGPVRQARPAGDGNGEAFVPYRPTRYMTDLAQEIQQRSVHEWGDRRAVTVVGLSDPLQGMLTKVRKVAAFEEPVLITGESGAGKESLAQSIHLLSPRLTRPFITVNCPQYQGDLTASELFGHKRGSFSGAVADRKGCFEVADTGGVFLDEVADLPKSTQVMLLRTLATGEFSPVGATAAVSSDVRVIAATNRDLRGMKEEDEFREDLFYRLSFFRIEVPPLREREDDWALLAEFFLRRLADRYGVSKTFSAESMKLLARHDWPGNVRELHGIVTTGYAMSDGPLIGPADFVSQMESKAGVNADGLEESLWQDMTSGRGDFWTTIHAAFMNRDLNRMQVQKLIRRGLQNAGGSYRKLLDELRLAPDDYQKLMDFLRHHKLKP